MPNRKGHGEKIVRLLARLLRDASGPMAIIEEERKFPDGSRLSKRVELRDLQAVKVYLSQPGEGTQATPRREKIKILFLGVNPRGATQLGLDEEAREIEAKIRISDFRDSVEFITKWAARPDDLLQALNQHRPHVVHFSGHGAAGHGLIFQDAQGAPKPVGEESLAHLFRVLKDNVRIALLNACFSRAQAEAIVREIDCAIGMTEEIDDAAAIVFASSFYRAIGFGRSAREAFDQGATALLLEGLPQAHVPRLLTRDGVDPGSIILIEPEE